MKTIKFLIAIISLFNLTANAQITKGNWMVGGSGSFSSYKSTFEDNNIEVTQSGTGLQVSPNIGYFVLDKFCVGTAVSVSFSNPSGDNNNGHGYGFSPFVKYYFLKPEKMINFFTQLGYGYSEGKSQSSNFTNKTNSVIVKGGTAVFFNSSVALEVSIDYSSSKFNNNTKSNYLTLGIGFQIHLEKE